MGVFWCPSLPLLLSISDLNANTSGMILLDATGSGSKWVTQSFFPLVARCSWIPLPRPRAGIKGAAAVGRNGETSQVGVPLPLPQEHLHSSAAAATAAARRHQHLLTGESLYDSISSSLPLGLSALLCLLIDPCQSQSLSPLLSGSFFLSHYFC